MTNKKTLTDIPFDQYSRQFQVAAMINDLRAPGQLFRILDVGGYKGRTAEFFPLDQVIILDVFDVNEANYVKGSGLGLPFEEAEYDFVVNFDVLEHIAAPDRHQFVEECVRVADRAVFISAPHRTLANEQAEKSLNEMYKGLHGKEHEWLKEHIGYGLPQFEDIDEYLQLKGLYTATFPSNDTLLWVLMQQAIFLNSKFPAAAPELIKLNSFYNKNFPYDGGSSMDETYRIVLAATSKKADHDKLKKHFTEKNNPLNITQRMTLLQKIQSFEVTLAAKLTQEASNLRDMYAHESKRASELQKNGEDLWRRINDMEKDISLLENSSLTKRLLKAIRLITAKKETNLSRGEDNEK